MTITWRYFRDCIVLALVVYAIFAGVPLLHAMLGGVK